MKKTRSQKGNETCSSEREVKATSTEETIFFQEYTRHFKYIEKKNRMKVGSVHYRQLSFEKATL